MPSSSNTMEVVEEEKEENEDLEEETIEEVEGFNDFTLASSWERFISEIEAVCRLWLVDGPKSLMEKGAESTGSKKNLYKVKCDLKYGIKLYCMEYLFGTYKGVDWDDDLHNLQLAFGVSDFVIIAPVSASGVVLDAPESCKLLSAVAIALSNCGSNWPAFVPVHDPSRKAYIGIQNMGTNFTRRFDADRIGSQVPIRLMHLEGLYELFVSKFALSSLDISTSCFKVHFTMKLTYRTPPADDEEDIVIAEPDAKETRGDTDGQNHIKSQWDDDCPWTEWYSAEDPYKGFELTAIWSSKMFESSLEMAELENASPMDAGKWLIFPLMAPNMVDDSIGKLVGFASQLHLLVGALEMSFEAKFLEDFVSAENLGSGNSTSASVLPPPSVIDHVLKEIFHDGVQNPEFVVHGNKSSRPIKGAPQESLFSQFCLHSLWFSNCNIRAIAVLWIEFVREVRWFWDESQPLPRMAIESSIDLSACLVHQKLQMMAICIVKKSLLKFGDHHNSTQRNKDTLGGNKVDIQAENCGSQKLLHEESINDEHVGSSTLDGYDDSQKNFEDSDYSVTSADAESLNQSRRGSAGIVGSMMLLHSFQEMHYPYTQDTPIMTEDMHEERLHAVEVFGDAFSFSGQLERDTLASDMSAFKAANPKAVFEDFIRWHSPGDWDNGEILEKSVDDKMKSLHCDWPPKGRLSQRMSEHGNLWRQIWNESPALPASEQKPLFDPIREGEKVLHYLETLRPYQLLEQMVCTAFRASVDTLNQTTYGDLKLMKTKISQLYSTLGSTLRPLQANHLPDKDELIGDLRQLCLIFEHIEKLLILATSIHRKLRDAPRLSEAIFNDYFEFYLPKMGTGLASMCYEKEFNTKQPVKMQEREAVMGLFRPPTANQSWRKVLSMGNLLNGHEPAQREIIFSTRDDSLSEDRYGASSPSGPTEEEIETHRMYICGTSNDLGVALSTTSWD